MQNINLALDNDLVKKVQDDACSESLLELSKRHSPLCFSIFNKFQKSVTACGKSFEDLLREKDYLIWSSCRSFDSTKNTKFSTWLANQVNYACLNYINRNVHNTTSLDDPEAQTTINNLSGITRNNDNQEFCMHILNKLGDKRIVEIYNLRYFDDKEFSWKDIASKLEVSIQTAINLHEKGKDFLRKKLTSNACVDTI